MEHMIGEPRVVAAGRGAAWWGEGWRIFAAQPFTWIGIMLIYIVVSLLLNLVPIVGSVGQALLTPVFMGGMMLGCRSIERDGTLRVAHLFEGFQGAHFVPLMIIGAVNIAFFVGLALLGTAGTFGTLGMASLVTPGADPFDMFAGSLRAMTGVGLLIGLVVLVVAACFAMLNWFAPALVALRGASGWQAMKHSFQACLRNWVPFLIYGLIGMAVVSVLAGVFILLAFFSLASAFTGTSSGVGAMIVFMIIVGVVCGLIGLVAGPLVFGSTYAGYKDSFPAPDERVANPAYR